MPISVVDADLDRPEHCTGLVASLDEYARLLHIAGRGLPAEVIENLTSWLVSTSGKQILLAVDGEKFIGVAVCFEAFSTVAGRPLLNIHDLAVTGACRGQGVNDAIGSRRSACQRTRLLPSDAEVDMDNPGAKKLYERSGFVMTQEFWKKELQAER